MKHFEPIAIVGQSCVLPGAPDPEALWQAVAAGEDLVSTAPEGRWGLSSDSALTQDPADSADRAWSDRGGYVHGWEQQLEGILATDPFDRHSGDQVRSLDPLFQWVLHTGRTALRQAGRSAQHRVGAIFGNLSFPSSAMSRFAQGTWLQDNPHLASGQAARVADTDGTSAVNRYMSGLPALLLARELGLDAGSFALDAACASSLYAIKLACDKLADRQADVMLAGAVCRSDDLFIHVGFCALKAMSQTGRTRPFHAEADGLVPGEGAAMVALKRLSDAEAEGDTILGVIRGVGLSNDGRGRGLLAPSAAGQVRAMRAAYEQAGLSPADVTWVECHATGTTVGDATELRSMAEVFGQRDALPIGSLKSNMGHLITAAGAAGLLKVLAAMHHGVRPPTLHLDELNPALVGTPFRAITRAEPWEGRKLAAVSAFGFGGNNAHLLVEPWEGPGHAARLGPAAPVRGDVAIVGLGLRVGQHPSTREVADALFAPAGGPTRGASVELPLMRLRFPPNDLQQTLPQQLWVLDAALQATDSAPPLDPVRTAVLIGSQADPEVCRYGARWRLADWAKAWSQRVPQGWLSDARDAVVPVLKSAGVVGNMPNIPANRINSQFDFGGPGFTVSSEELSGFAALRTGLRLLRAGEVDAALIGAVDLCDEPVHRAASALLPADRRQPGDAAVVLVCKRLDDARRDGDAVLAVFPSDPVQPEADFGPHGTHLAPRFGHAHAASGLLHVAAAALALGEGKLPDAVTAARPWNGNAALAHGDAFGSADNQLLCAAPADVPRWRASTRPAFEGPTLTFAAHPPQIRLPALPDSPVVGADAPGDPLMQPAPFLPSALQDPPAQLDGPTGFEPENIDRALPLRRPRHPRRLRAPQRSTRCLCPALPRHP